MSFTAPGRRRSRRRGDRVDVLLHRRGHLPALHLRHPAVREKDEDIHRLEPAERLDRRAAGVAARRAHDGHPFAPALERRFEELPDELHREVLEGQRGPVEEFEQEMVRRQLLERRACRVAEARIGARCKLGEGVLGEAFRDEGIHDAHRRLLVGKPRQRGDVALGHARDGLGHIKPAVARKPRQHRVLEAKNGRLPPRGNVSHDRVSLRPVLPSVRQTRNMLIAAQTAASPNQVTAYSR